MQNRRFGFVNYPKQCLLALFRAIHQYSKFPPKIYDTFEEKKIMDTISKALLTIHIFAGFSSLVLFWIPIFLKKGSDWHIKIGKIYMVLMWIVVISAAILSIKNIIIGSYIMASFLGFLALITANPLWYGIAILKNKNGLSLNYRKKHMTFNILITIAGLALLLFGIYLKGQNAGLLMIIFGILGLSTGKEVVSMYRNPKEKSNWIVEHIDGMLTSGIAAYTAFAVFGAGSFMENVFQGYWSILPWIMPTILGTIGLRYYKNKYIKKKKVTSA